MSALGITGKVILNDNYPSLILRVSDNLDYSGGTCDELQGYKDYSVVYGRIKYDGETVGVIRCIVNNQFQKIGGNERVYRTFDDDDSSTISQIAALCSIIIVILNYSEQEKMRSQELQHETITPISIIKLQAEDLKFDIMDFAKLNSKQLSQRIDSGKHFSDDETIWSTQSIADFSLWAYKLDIIRFEADMAGNFILTPNVVEIPIAKYNFEDLPLSVLLTPLFHHANYLAGLKNVTIARFKKHIYEAREARYYARADRRMFSSAFLHIIDNAMKYCDINAPSISGNIWFEMNFKKINSETFLQLLVCNSGSPPPEEEREIIFAKYQSGKKAKANNLAGKGLGLYVARTVMQNHGGDVLLCCETGDHTAFEIRLPVSKRT